MTAVQMDRISVIVDGMVLTVLVYVTALVDLTSADLRTGDVLMIIVSWVGPIHLTVALVRRLCFLCFITLPMSKRFHTCLFGDTSSGDT